jgi:hypothetical protein
MRTPAILLATLLLGWRADNDSIVLSVAARPSAVPLSEPVTLVISLRNRSDETHYVHRDVRRQLDFAVRSADGRLVRGFMHPPLPPPTLSNSRDWVRIDGKKAIRCIVVMPLADLGIEQAGEFSLTGFWSGESAKAPQVGSEFPTFHFEHAETTYLTVFGNKTPADIGLHPTAKTPGGELPNCSAAEAERQPAQ